MIIREVDVYLDRNGLSYCENVEFLYGDEWIDVDLLMIHNPEDEIYNCLIYIPSRKEYRGVPKESLRIKIAFFPDVPENIYQLNEEVIVDKNDFIMNSISLSPFYKFSFYDASFVNNKEYIGKKAKEVPGLVFRAKYIRAKEHVVGKKYYWFNGECAGNLTEINGDFCKTDRYNTEFAVDCLHELNPMLEIKTEN